MEGQKVVKVFCHEDESIARFDALNDALADSADNANRYANILMPVMANIGNLSYVLTAILGRLLALFGTGGFTLGGWHPFCSSTKASTSPSHRYHSSSTPSSWRWQARSAYSA